jgi:membrane protein
MSAALAYYTLFSLAPVLIITIAIAGQVYGEQAVTGVLEEQMRGLVGKEAANIIKLMIAYNDNRSTTSSLVTSIVIPVTLWWAASNLFNQLQDMLNTLWGVTPRSASGVLGFLRARLLAVIMVVGMGFLLIFSIMILSLTAGINENFSHIVPDFVRLVPIVDFVVSMFLLTIALMGIYQLLPNINLGWKDVIIGALFTASLLVFGKFLISWYLGASGLQSAYGAAGSLVILLVWCYYSAQIFLLGAAFTKLYAKTYGSRKPKPKALTAADLIEEQTGQQAWPALHPPPAKESLSLGTWFLAIFAFFVGIYLSRSRKVL